MRRKAIPLTKEVCTRCDGKGWREVVQGRDLRAAREATGATLTATAESLVVSIGYLCDVEKGHRRATERVVAYYRRTFGEEE
jgi:hypothetical protein